jgi:hypothetical protein
LSRSSPPVQQETWPTASGRGSIGPRRRKLLRGWRGIDENHVVVQALRKSHIEALRAVLRTFRATARTAPNRSELEAFAEQVEGFANIE